MHKTVLSEEVSRLLEAKPGEVIVDCTLGEGGHSEQLLSDTLGRASLVAIDLDKDAMERARTRLSRFDCRQYFYSGNFSEIDIALSRAGYERADKIVVDLGVSSYQLDHSGRGFTFKNDEPLLMTLSDSPLETDTTAKDVVNLWSEESLADVIYGFGEERSARKIARAIVSYREKKEIESSVELAEIVRGVVKKTGRIDPATRTFQAIRMAVNREVENLEAVLAKGLAVLKKGGRMAVIAFHSIEDRIVKNFIKNKSETGEVLVLTKKPITPSEAELAENKRSRSAKLRVFEKAV